MRRCDKNVFDEGVERARRCKRRGRYHFFGRRLCGQHFGEAVLIREKQRAG